MATYRLIGSTFAKVKFYSIFETNDLVKYGIENKVLSQAFNLEIWEMLPQQGTCLLLQIEDGAVKHGRELYEKLYGKKIADITIDTITAQRQKAMLALPLLNDSADRTVVKKHKLVRRTA